MNCQDIHHYLYSYIDKETSQKLNKEIEKHLLMCPLCKILVEEEVNLNKLFKTYFPREEAPYSLKEKVLDILEERRRRRKTLNLFLKFTFSLMIIIGVYIGINHFRYTSPSLEKVFDYHIALIEGKLTPKVIVKEPLSLKKTLQAKVDFKLMLPHLFSEDIEFIGADAISWENKNGVIFSYVKEKHLISVFMYETEDNISKFGKKVTLDNKDFYIITKKGYNGVFWVDKGILCIFISDLKLTELLHLASS